MTNRTQRLVACLFVVVIFTPLIVGLFGYKPKAIENRPLTEFPAMRGMFSDPKFLDRAKDALTDHLPLRAEVVTAGAWLDMALFKLSYNPMVKVGNDDWLFSTAEIYDRCKDPLPPKVDGIKQFGDMLAGHGITFIFTLAPNKAAIYPEKLGALLHRANRCLIQRRVKTQRLMAQHAAAYFVDLWSDFFAAKSIAQRPLYLSLDTHWTATGAALASKDVVNRLHPGLWDDGALVVSPPSMVLGNLTYMNGLAFSEPMQFVKTSRPGVVVVEETQPSGDTQYIHRFKATSSGPYLIPGRTILVHDSFFERTMDLLPPYFEDITFISEHIHGQPETIDLIANSDTFIMALVERTFMGTGWYHEPDYQSEIEKAINQGTASRN